MSRSITQIVLTGGACAGKTFGLRFLESRCRAQGWAVVTCPEAVTTLIASGIRRPELGDHGDLTSRCKFQHAVYALQRSLRRDAYLRAQARAEEQCLILYDRGELDALAYHEHECIDQLLEADSMDRRLAAESYDAVIHLVTAADGAVDSYSITSNPARYESPSQARRQDARLQELWRSAHSRWFMVDNGAGFEDKMERLFAHVQTVMAAQMALA
jgi:thymidylate kinase